jgi:2,4-dienoyl-CoA reductase-like NADH-dependent reductase (Old Yellow Enzyme family)
MNIGSLQIDNRFVRSGTFESMAKATGECTTSSLNELYKNLAQGEIGLIITGYMFVHKNGRGHNRQIGIHSDEMMPGLRNLVRTVHEEEGKIIFQLAHSGRQTSKKYTGTTPLAPSKIGRDPLFFEKAKEMSEEEIEEIISAFVRASERAVEAEADGIQLLAAHGYLINEFLSPFFNHRKDKWGGSDENKFRFLRKIVSKIKHVVPKGFPVMVKLNSHDYVSRNYKNCITPKLAVKYAKWLAESKIDAIEVSCGTTFNSVMSSIRGDIPVKELVDSLPLWQKPIAWLLLKRMTHKYNFEEGYNLKASKMMKPSIGKTSLMVVGGFRTVSYMEEVIEKGYTDFIALSRPFIRDPSLVKRIKEEKIDRVSCISCNKCFAGLAYDLPLNCYTRGIPR